uniref:cytosolic carboxypeptidase 1-like n=1 Tax=Styela clava TaxID=7725 RepID=UPI0019396464|nr:cytosolic carboxypeptidase 1-like [Styela clava]
MSLKMSSKTASAETKSKTKALLLMLEKVISSTSPDKEQTRFLCHKLLHFVNNHEAARKEISSKSSLETVISILETCGDQPTCLSLVNILGEIASGNGMKRLVNHDVTRVLLHTVAYLGKEADNRLLIALLSLSVKIAPKDKRFALRVRLAGALPILISIVRSSSASSSNKLLSNTLQCLKICASNGVNANILGRLGAVHVLQKLVLSIGRKQPPLVKTALSALSLLVKSSRSNANHGISSGMVSNMLSIHQEWHKNDVRSHKHIPARKSMLNILKHLTVSKRGKTAFVEAGGMRILHRTCKECIALSCSKPAEPLLNVATMILRRCQPRFRLPIPTVQCSFQFQLPQVEEKEEKYLKSHHYEGVVDDVIDASDEDDEDEDSLENQDQEILETEEDDLVEDKQEETKDDLAASPPIIIPPISTGIPPKRSAADLKSMYEKFFSELQDFPTDGSNNIQEDTVFLHPHILHKLKEQTNNKDVNENLKTNNSEVKYKQQHSLSRAHSEGSVLSIQCSSLYYDPPASAPSPSINSGDEHSSLMATLSSSTQSQKQRMNTVSFADYFGHTPPSFLEHQVVKRYGVQRIKMLEDIGRTLKQGDVINKVIYTRDGNYKPPKSNDYWQYEVEPCTSNMQLLKEVMGNGFNEEMTSSEMTEEVQSIGSTPIIQDACCFSPVEANYQSFDGPWLSSGCQESSTIFPPITDQSLKLKRPLNFCSDFECGNLRTAIQVRENEYDLILDSDCNTNHHHQWFYFEVSNVTSGVPYRFNIVNCEKSNSQFNYGMQPLMYSVSEARLGNPCWRRAGTNLCYYKSHFSRSAVSAGGVKGRSYFTMTFTVNFTHNKDICYFAYHYPYTYTQLQADLHKLVSQVDENEVYVRVQTLCQTLGQNKVPVLTITAQPDFNEEKDNEEAIAELRSRPYIFLSSRVHPGESNSSWTMRGTLKLLLSSKNSTDINPKMLGVAQQLRRSFIFKIVPMLNPDGVINGHHRCSLTGEDLNRQWTDPDPVLFPTIYHTKGLLQYLYSIGKAPLVYCDYHGHSRRKNVFMYGCSRRESVIAGESDVIQGAPDDTGYKTIPKLLNKMAPAFSMSNCSFIVEKCKESTARVVVWKEMGVARSYTMESTYCGCDQGKYKSCQIGTYELEEMGMILCESLLHLKNRERARRLPLYDGIFSEEDKLYNSISDVSSGDFQSVGSEIKQDNSGSERMAPCPTNSDEEFTPDEADSIGSFDGTSEQPSASYSRDETLMKSYPHEFWDYNEFCRGFGFGPEEEGDYDITPRANDPESTSSLPNDDVVHRNHGDFLIRSSYQICPDTGRVLYNDNDTVDTTLVSMMERNSMYEKRKQPKS